MSRDGRLGSPCFLPTPKETYTIFYAKLLCTKCALKRLKRSNKKHLLIFIKFQFAGPESITAIISTGQQIIALQIYLADTGQEYEGYRVKPDWETCELPYSISLEAPVPIISEEQNHQSASYVRQ